MTAQISVAFLRARRYFVLLVFTLAQGLTTGAVEAEPAKVLNSVVSVLPQWANPKSRAKEPEGSGVVILDGRKIITARHVVKGAVSVKVRTIDGRVLRAQVIGQDRLTDLALLNIEERLPPLSFGRQARIGEPVCAIGNAFGLGLSMTCGVVSAVHKAGVGFNPIEDFIQTDAAVNPGASGGALISSDGTLLGILSAIFTKRSDANIGVNFAVSSQLSNRVANLLERNKTIQWRFSGLKLNPSLEPGTAGILGAIVLSVVTDTPAQKAGLQKGDIILQAGSRRIRNPSDFTSVFISSNPGSKLDLKVVRKKSEITLKIVVPR